MKTRRLPVFLPGWPLVLIALGALLSPLLLGVLDFQIDPARAWVHHTGHVATWLLVATLCMTPLQRVTGWPGWIRWRRTLGLLMFFMATLHLLAFAGLWQGFDLGRLTQESLKRPYLWLGLTAWTLLLSLALTSSKAAQRRLGLRWKKLHQSLYVITVLLVWHQAWANKIGLLGVWPEALVLLLLLLYRVYWRFLRKKPAVRK